MQIQRSLVLTVVLITLVGGLWLCYSLLGGGASESELFGLGEEVHAGELGPGGLHGPGSDPGSETNGAGDGRREIVSEVRGDSDAEVTAGEGEGRSRLVGTVVRGSGIPVEGARVVARRTQPWFSPPADLEQMNSMNSPGPRFETETDAEGHFVLYDVPAGKLAFSVRASGFAPLQRSGVEVPEHKAFDLGRFQLQLGITLSGQVYGARGKGVEGVQVLCAVTRDSGSTRLELPGYGIPLSVTDADGRFEVDTLAPGSWHLIFDSTDHRVAELKGKTEPEGNSDRSLMVTLKQGLSIEGQVVGLVADPGEELRVTARRDDEQPSGAADDVEGAERYRPRHGEVLADGTFAVSGLAPGVQYKLRLYRRELPKEVAEPQEGEEPDQAVADAPGRWDTVRGVDDVVVMSGARRVEFKYRDEAVVLIKVQDAETGSPLSRFHMRVNGDGLRGGGLLEDEDGEPLGTHAGGVARFAELLPAETGSSLTVLVRAEGFKNYEKKNVMLRPGQELDLGVCELEPAPTGKVKVIDEVTGEPVAGARVIFAKATDEGSIARWIGLGRKRPLTDSKVRDAITDEKGIAVLTLWDGSICVMGAFAEGYRTGEGGRHVPPYDKTVEMKLVRGGKITVRAVDGEGRPVGGMYVEHKVDGKSNNRRDWGPNSGQEHKTGDTGEVVFSNLREGQHTFHVLEKRNVWGRGGESAGFEAEGDVFLNKGEERELELRVTARGGLAVTILESGRPLAGALAKISPIDGEAEDGFWYFGGGQDDPRSDISDHAGRVKFSGIKVGRYTLRVSHPERRMVVSREVLVLAEPDELVFDVGIAVIEGRVLDPEGQPIEGVSISVSVKNSEGNNYDMNDYRVRITEDEDGDADWDVDEVKPWSIRSDENGRYLLRGLTPERLLKVRVSDQYVVGETQEVGPLGSDEYVSPFDFILDRAGVLRVELSGVDRKERGRLRVNLTRMAGDTTQESRSSRMSSWRSYTTIKSLHPGTWKLKLTHRDSKKVLLEQDVKVEIEKTNRITLHL